MQVFFAYFLYLYYYMQYISKYKQFSFSFFQNHLSFYSPFTQRGSIIILSLPEKFLQIPHRSCSGVYLTPALQEREIIDKKMELLGTHNQRAYLRKMAVDGYVVRVDMTDVKELAALLRTCSNNLNQIARRVNSTGNLYEEDITDLKTRYGELWGAFSSLLSKFEDL